MRSTVSSGDLALAAQPATRETFNEVRGGAGDLSFSPDGNALYAASDHLKDSVIHVWRATSVATAEKQLLQHHTR